MGRRTDDVDERNGEDETGSSRPSPGKYRKGWLTDTATSEGEEVTPMGHP
jgi:hypothetical protein